VNVVPGVTIKSGDFNCNMLSLITSFIDEWSLIRCDKLYLSPIRQLCSQST